MGSLSELEVGTRAELAHHEEVPENMLGSSLRSPSTKMTDDNQIDVENKTVVVVEGDGEKLWNNKSFNRFWLRRSVQMI